VWLEGTGWQRVDPTAAVAPERVEIGVYDALFEGIGESWGFSTPAMWKYQLEMVYDLANAKWDEWVLGYGPEAQENLMNFFGMADPNWRKMMLTLISIVIALVLFISYLMYRKYRPPRLDKAAVLYQRLVRKVGVQPVVGETPVAWMWRVSDQTKIPADKLNSVTNAYLDARYGPDDDDALERLRKKIVNL
jgi:hypothetical protein